MTTANDPLSEDALLATDPVLRRLLAEIERLRAIEAAAQRYILASSDDRGPYSEEQQAYDALNEALGAKS